ncbi:MAG: riboflavin synthase [Bacteroidota bacterium]
MFTGIIETVGKINKLEHDGSNINLFVESPVDLDLKVDQSLSHNGVCLTVTSVQGKEHQVTIIEESLSKSNLGDLKPGSLVNLERCMPANGRFDGHVVQGHVDQTGTCVGREEKDGSWLFHFEFDEDYSRNVTVEKGSICINGVSLTCFNSEPGKFTVAIIPYTYENTVFQTLREGDKVNLEFDIIGKYVERLLSKTS